MITRKVVINKLIMNVMVNTLTRAQIIFAIIILISLLVIFVIFEWRFVQYPSKPDKNDPVICYSPNHEYYVKRYQTFFDSLYNDGGAVVVYDGEGHKIAQGTASLSVNNLLWTSYYGGSISIGESGSDWFEQLPTSPVNNSGEDSAKGCY